MFPLSLDFSKLNSFERILWRISKGNIFLKHSNIDEDLVDPTTGDEVRKSIFLLFFQGEELKSRVKKVCEGYHASIYPCPESLGMRIHGLKIEKIYNQNLICLLQNQNFDPKIILLGRYLVKTVHNINLFLIFKNCVKIKNVQRLK